MDRFWQDLRFAARLLWKDRSFTLTTVATLGICLAANAAIFAVVDSVLLKPLPFPEPDRLVSIYNQYPGAGVEFASNGVPDYYDRLTGMPALDALASYRQAGMTVGGQGQGDPERIQGLVVTPSFLPLLRVQAYRGRIFIEQDGEVGHDTTVLLAYGYWQRAFGGRDSAIGEQLRIGGELLTIVGVLPPDFRFIDPDIQLVRPVAFTPEQKADDQRHSNNWQEIGRLKAGATLQQAQAQLDAINAANDARFPSMHEALRNAGFHTSVAGFHDELVKTIRRTLALLWGAVAFVLVIGCVNVANLVLVRATARVRELATRHALGAGVGRLARQYITESMLLSLIGGVVGLGLGWWALTASPLLGFDRLPRGAEISMDGRVGAFTLVLVGLVGMAMAVMPVIAMGRVNLGQVVREEGRTGTASRGSRVARRLLVTSQVAFALILLIGAGVMLASFRRVLSVDLGFRTERVLTGLVALPPARYKDDPAIVAAVERMLERVQHAPGVEQAGITTTVPFSGNYNDSVILAEGYQMAPGESLISPHNVTVSEGYFETMGAQLVAGRMFTAADAEGRQKVLVVDERLARKFWPKGDAVGHRMYFPTSNERIFEKPSDDQMLTVVGVIKDMRLTGVVDPAGFQGSGTYYFPFRQNSVRQFGFAIRSSADPSAVIGTVRRELASIDPELPFYSVRTMEERTNQALLDRRTPTILAGGFALVALLLAAIGIYGVLSYQVSQRRREIGIRMALGAGASTIFGLVLREGAVIVMAGGAIGLAGAFFLRRVLASQLYGVDAMDPIVVATVGAVLGVVALAACLLPARRAAKTDPVVALAE